MKNDGDTRMIEDCDTVLSERSRRIIVVYLATKKAFWRKASVIQHEPCAAPPESQRDSMLSELRRTAHCL
jgi:hypothetical protein